MHAARAVVVHEAGAVPTLEDIELVDPVDDEVLVDIAASGICHTDLSAADGVLSTPYPVVLGHEGGAGVVRACGPGVRRFAPGDRVVVSVAHHCGHCRYCETGYPPLCLERFAGRARYQLRGGPMLQAYGTGTFTTSTVLREGSLAPVPVGVPLTVAAVTGCAVVTGFGAVTEARVEPGSTVAVFGCGGVGASAVMAAVVSGASRVVAVDPNPTRRELALRVGATEAVGPDPDVLRALEPQGFDYVFESAGRTEAMEMAVAVARPTATITLMGLPGPDARLALPVLDFANSAKRLIGCNMGRMRPHVDFPAYFRLYESGRLPLDALVGATRSLEEAAEAFELARTGASARVLLTGDVE